MDAYFIVLSPGPADEVKEIQKATHFEKFPFIVDEDLILAKSLRLRLSATQIWPAILHIEPSLRLRPVHFGRAPGFYGISVLMGYLRNHREKIENQSLDVLQEAKMVLTRITNRLLNSPPPTTETELPVDILVCIFEYLNPNSLAIAAQTCRKFNYVSLISLKDHIRFWVREVEFCCPRSIDNKVVSHTQLNQIYIAHEDLEKNVILRKAQPISRLRDATNYLRRIITSYMTLGDKILISY